jgi:hypothetical protein
MPQEAGEECGFDPVERIERLHAFFNKHDLFGVAARMDKELGLVTRK